MAEDLMQPLPLPANNTPVQPALQATPPNVAPLLQQLTAKFPTQSFAKLLIVDAGAQRMYLVEQGQPVGGWVISTATNGVGSAKGSDKTPLGLHRIAEKIGDGAALGTIFKSRQNTGKQVEILTAPGADSKDDYVTSRIMWLDGLEPGVNKGGDVDSKERFIYIHGTGEEGKLGTPASHGCIRMKNADVINLFNRVDENTLVYITQNLAN
jgi:lipoprotein-anchoring transpeptidase ErfK/SrfK